MEKKTNKAKPKPSSKTPNKGVIEKMIFDDKTTKMPKKGNSGNSQTYDSKSMYKD